MGGKIMTWSDVIEGIADYDWLKQLLGAVEWILWIALILVGAVGAVYAIYIGVKMARADSSEQREESKKRLINIIVSIVVTIALILFFNLILPLILNTLGVFDSYYQDGSGVIDTPEQTSLNAIINTARTLIGR